MGEAASERACGAGSYQISSVLAGMFSSDRDSENDPRRKKLTEQEQTLEYEDPREWARKNAGPSFNQWKRRDAMQNIKENTVAKCAYSCWLANLTFLLVVMQILLEFVSNLFLNGKADALIALMRYFRWKNETVPEM